MRQNKGVPASPSGHSGFAPSPKGLGHSESVPNVGGLFASLAHGDGEHRAWLREAIEAHFAGQPIPHPRGSGRKEALIADMQDVLCGFVRNRRDITTHEPFQGALSRLMDMAERVLERSASGIEAPSGVETGNTDSTEGESPTAESGGAQ